MKKMKKIKLRCGARGFLEGAHVNVCSGDEGLTDREGIRVRLCGFSLT